MSQREQSKDESKSDTLLTRLGTLSPDSNLRKLLNFAEVLVETQQPAQVAGGGSVLP